MKKEEITLLPEVKNTTSRNLFPDSFWRGKLESPAMSFHGNFRGYGELRTFFYYRENTYNIFEDKVYENDVIIEFENHTIKNSSLFHSKQNTPIYSAKELIEFLEQLEIVPNNDDNNEYQKFLEEIDLEYFESLNYPVRLEYTQGYDLNSEKYVTLFVSTNTFMDKNNSQKLSEDEIDDKLLINAYELKRSYLIHREGQFFDVYTIQMYQTPEGVKKRLVHIDENYQFYIEPEDEFLKDDISSYIENKVIPSKAKNGYDKEYEGEENEEEEDLFIYDSGFVYLDDYLQAESF